MDTDPARELAERLAIWARGDPVALALRLAGVDRSTLHEAYRILEELIRQQVEAEVDREIAAHGPPTDAELEVREAELALMPQHCMTPDDLARLERITREVAKSVLAEHPDAPRDVSEQIVFARLRQLAATLGLVFVIVLAPTIMHKAWSAEPLPYPKGNAQCSGSYMQSGAFCVPKTRDAKPAMPKPRADSGILCRPTWPGWRRSRAYSSRRCAPSIRTSA